MDKTYTKTFNIACSVMQIAGTKENPGECSQAKSNAYREKLFYRREGFPFSRNINVVSVCIKNYRRRGDPAVLRGPTRLLAVPSRTALHRGTGRAAAVPRTVATRPPFEGGPSSRHHRRIRPMVRHRHLAVPSRTALHRGMASVPHSGGVGRLAVPSRAGLHRVRGGLTGQRRGVRRPCRARR